MILGAIGISGALVDALAGEASQFAGTTGVRPCAFPGSGTVLGGGAVTGEANERLIAIVHGDDHVPAVLLFSAADVAGDSSDVILGLQSRHFVGIGPGARELDE